MNLTSIQEGYTRVIDMSDEDPDILSALIKGMYLMKIGEPVHIHKSPVEVVEELAFITQVCILADKYRVTAVWDVGCRAFEEYFWQTLHSLHHAASSAGFVNNKPLIRKCRKL